MCVCAPPRMKKAGRVFVVRDVAKRSRAWTRTGGTPLCFVPDNKPIFEGEYAA